MYDSIAQAYQRMINPIKEAQELQEQVTPEPEIIVEKLSDDEEYEVDGWDHDREPHVDDKIHSVFKGQHRMTIPLGANLATEPHPEVADHIESHNHHIRDYVAGIAADNTTGREISIGKLLSRTDAPQHVVSSFANDPARTAARGTSDSMHVVISHHPYDVAGMTSRGHSWANESCMNFNTGGYRQHLPHEVKNGTHVAYLTHKDDEHLENPVARIAIKPYHNEDDNGDVIFRPEQRTYGKGGDLFHSTVAEWSQKHYPATGGARYHIADMSYADTDNEYEETSHDDVRKAVEKGHSVKGLTGDSFSGQTVAVKHALKLNAAANIASPDKKDHSLRGFIIQNFRLGGDSRFHNKVARTLLSHSGENDASFDTAIKYHSVMHGGSYDTDNLHKVIAHLGGSGEHLPMSIVRNKKLPDHVVDSLRYDQLDSVSPNKIKDHHIQKVVDAYSNNESGSWYPVRHFSNKMNLDHTKTVVDRLVDKHDIHSISPFLSGTQHKDNEEIHDHVISRLGKGRIGDYVAGMPSSAIKPKHIDALVDVAETPLNASKRIQRSILADSANMQPETIKYAVGKVAELYHQTKAPNLSSPGHHIYSSISMEEVPSEHISDEHIKTFVDHQPSMLHLSHDAMMRVHHHMLDKLSKATDDYISKESPTDEDKTHMATLHAQMAENLSDHFTTDHMTAEYSYSAHEDHKNHAPEPEHVDAVTEIAHHAEELADKANAHEHMGFNEHDNYSDVHSKAGDAHQGINSYHERHYYN